MIKTVSKSRYKYLRLYLRNFAGNLVFQRKSNLKYLKYLLERKEARFQRKKNYKLRNLIRLNLKKRGKKVARWGMRNWRRITSRKRLLWQRQGFRHIFPMLRLKQIRKNVHKASSANSTLFLTGALQRFELRLDVLLWRLNFFFNLKDAYKWFTLKGGSLIINDRVINCPSFLLKMGDRFSIPLEYKRSFARVIRKRQKAKTMIHTIPPYLVMNHVLLSGVILKTPSMKEISYHSRINLVSVLNYMRSR